MSGEPFLRTDDTYLVLALDQHHCSVRRQRPVYFVRTTKTPQNRKVATERNSLRRTTTAAFHYSHLVQ